MTDEKNPSHTTGIRTPPPQASRRHSHETQMLRPIALIDPDQLLGEQSPHPSSPTRSPASIDELLSSTTTSEIDLLFADVLPTTQPEPPARSAPPVRSESPARPEPPTRPTSPHAPLRYGTPPPPTRPAQTPNRAYPAAPHTTMPHTTMPHRMTVPSDLLDAPVEDLSSTGQPLPRTDTTPLEGILHASHAPTKKEATPQALKETTMFAPALPIDIEELLAAPTERSPSPQAQTSTPAASANKGTTRTRSMAVASANTERNHPVDAALAASGANTDVISRSTPPPVLRTSRHQGIMATLPPQDAVPTQQQLQAVLSPLRSLPPQDDVATQESTPSSPALPKSTPSSSALPRQHSALHPPPCQRLTDLPFVRMAQQEPVFQRNEEPRYEELKHLEYRGHTEHILIKDNDLQRLAVLKRLHADHHSPLGLAPFFEHLQHIGQLNHPSIPPVHDVGIDAKGRYYYIEKYVGGETLDTIINKLQQGDSSYHQRFHLAARLEIVTALIHTIRFAHDQGIVHGDLTPACVIVGPYGEVYVRHWELARQERNRPSYAKVETLLPSSLTPATNETISPSRRLFQCSIGTHTITGTPAYMSPERLLGNPANERSDIYSLCATVYELLTLRHYLHLNADNSASREQLAAFLQTIARTSPAPATTCQGPTPLPLSPKITLFLQRGLEKDPTQRPTRLEEFYHACQQVPPDTPKRHPLTFALMGLCLALAAYGLFQLGLQVWGIWMGQP